MSGSFNYHMFVALNINLQDSLLGNGQLVVVSQLMIVPVIILCMSHTTVRHFDVVIIQCCVHSLDCRAAHVSIRRATSHVASTNAIASVCPAALAPYDDRSAL